MLQLPLGFYSYVRDHKQFDQFVALLDQKVDKLSPKNKYVCNVLLHEALNNAIEHGALPLEVSMIRNSSSIRVTIKDSGNGFDVASKLKMMKEKGLDRLFEEIICNERGRGIFMLFKLAKSVVYNAQGNAVSFTIKSKKCLS